MGVYHNWQLQQDDLHILWLEFNRENAVVNTLNIQVLEEFNAILDEVANSRQYHGLVIYSTKPKGFSAGADLQLFSQINDVSTFNDFIQTGQRIFDKLASLQIPTVAMITGNCLGGGMELALACDYRVAADTADTRLALPEILLGIHPGWGGTVRLPRLIGGFSALSRVILPGVGLWPTQALKIGMIDALVPLRQLRHAALYYIQEHPLRHQASWLQRITNYSGIRHILAKILRLKLQQRLQQQHYPAPYAVIANWESSGALGSQSQQIEATSIAQLVSQNDTAINLVRVFRLRDKLKAFAKESKFHATRIHVVGAGAMGGDIAAWCALKGLIVTLQDRDYSYIGLAIARAYKLFKKKLRKPNLIQAAMDRLIPDICGNGIATADIIIEAIFEDLALKQQLFKTLESQAAQHAILATNTSSITLEDIAVVLQEPQRLVGIHFFNPVAKMELVEVVHGQHTSPDIVHDACAVVAQLGRLPLPVISSPGFLINRVLMPYLTECMLLLAEGISAVTIDNAARDFGMPMGPVELADTVGLDVCLAVAKNLTQHYGGEIAPLLQHKVAIGELGKKTGKGFYAYRNGKKTTTSNLNATSNSTGQDIAHRLILRMVNEAAACLREGVVTDSDLLDAGMIFGTGFAPFRGGPMHYAHNIGDGQLKQMFQQLEALYGKRFKPDVNLN